MKRIALAAVIVVTFAFALLYAQQQIPIATPPAVVDAQLTCVSVMPSGDALATDAAGRLWHLTRVDIEGERTPRYSARLAEVQFRVSIER